MINAARRAFSASAQAKALGASRSWNTNIFCRNTGESSPNNGSMAGEQGAGGAELVKRLIRG